MNINASHPYTYIYVCVCVYNAGPRMKNEIQSEIENERAEPDVKNKKDCKSFLKCEWLCIATNVQLLYMMVFVQ